VKKAGCQHATTRFAVSVSSFLLSTKTLY